MKSIFFILSFLSFYFIQGQSSSYNVSRAADAIKVDGIFNEKTWAIAEKKASFIQHYPYDTCQSATKTEFMLSYDDKGLYCAVICYNRNPNKDFVLQTLKRDFSINNSDAVVLSMSPFQDGQNGFSFGVTPQNSQREGAIENGGVFGVSTAWDQIWYSATRIAKDTWFAEFEIPFKSIRFAEGNKVWKINLARSDFKNNEVSTWIKVPRNFNISVLNFGGDLIWAEAPIRKGKNIAIIPYMSTVSTGNAPYKAGTPFSKNTPRFGADIKIGLSSSLNMDITVNPDFAQVDVDVQQLNLSRFSLFFPERRQFFIENSDLFANFGFQQIRPFFSRRVGLGSNGNVPIDAGIRITGKINNKWRVGAMTVQTRGTNASFEEGAKNYMVVAFQRKLFKSSNVGFILVDDQNGEAKNFGKDKNRITGFEYNLQSKDSRWVGKAFIQKAFYHQVGKESWSHASYLNYRTIYWDIAWNHEYVGKDFRARSGFVPRIEFYDPVKNKTTLFSYYRLEPSVHRTFYPKKSVVNNYGFILYNSSYYDSFFKLTESNSSAQAKLMLQNSTEFRISASQNYYDFYLPFSPIRNPSLYMLGKYNWISGAAGFSSNNRKKINGIVDLYFGNYYGGTRYAISGSLNYRKQPWGLLSLTYRYEDIDLGQLGRTKYNLLGAKVDISFSAVMYFTSFLQYNTQTQNVNINLRYQWRYQPLSDFFIVYSENYSPEFNSKNRTLAFKFVYWFNT
jgi:Domain of unknown function (DUF5916)